MQGGNGERASGAPGRMDGDHDADVERVYALQRLAILDTPPEERFDRITRLAVELLGVDGALVNLIDKTRQWTKSWSGVEGGEVPREESLCDVTVTAAEQLVVPDLAADARFAGNPFVTGPDPLRAYVGNPLRVEGHVVGTFCVVGRAPRAFDEAELRTIELLGRWAEAELANDELDATLHVLADREAELSAVLEALPEAVLVVDDALRVRRHNTAAVEIFGCDGLLGTSLAELLPDVPAGWLPRRDRPEDAPLRRAPLDAAACRADGELVPVQVSASTLQLDARRSDDVLLLVRDLRADAATAVELRRARRITNLILDAVDSGVVGLDRHNLVVFANPAAAAMLRCEVEDLIGRDWHEAAHHSHEDGTAFPVQECAVWQSLADGTPVAAHDDLLWRRDGSSVVVELAVQPLVEAEVPVGAVLRFTDITERRALQRAQDEFVSVVSHELRTPLTSIRGSLGLLASGVAGAVDGDARRLLDAALTNTERLIRLVNDLLDIERLAAGRVPLDLRAVDGRTLLTAAAEQLAGAAAAADVRIRVAADEALPVTVDVFRMGQALANLVGNALKFSPAGAEVVLVGRRTTDPGSDRSLAALEVVDSGRGIPADRIEHIFERFGQVDSSDARVGSGTGLGLPISREIVEQHGGRVEVDSEPGRGSVFRVVLPLAAGEELAT